jgi:hypothetical protein
MVDSKDTVDFEVLQLKDSRSVPDVIHPYSLDIKRGHIPIVIDNGRVLFVCVRL